MVKSKYHLLRKRGNGRFNPKAEVSGEQRAKRVKRQRRQGTNSKWLRTRKKIKNMLLR